MPSENTAFLQLLKEVNPENTLFYLALPMSIVENDVTDFIRLVASPSSALDGFEIYRLELLLRLLLRSVDFIGELPISRETNNRFAQVLRAYYRRNGRISLGRAKHPALFITSMVFSARYSDIDERQFWSPYLANIWQIPKANSQAAYNACRKYFLLAKDFLSQVFGFDFPIYQVGDVVRPINYQAIIPYYLQDDFGQWMIFLLENFPNYDKSASDEVAGDATREWLRLRRQSIEKLAPTLQRFILGVDVSGNPTPETAERSRLLFKNMLQAFELYQQGEDAEVISQVLPNFIERDLWEQIKQTVMARQEQKTSARKRKPQIKWIWELNSGDLMLHLTNVYVESEPDVCVWVARGGAPDAPNAVVVDTHPRKPPAGGWLIENVLLSGGDPEGTLYVLSKEHDLEKSEPPLFTYSVPPLAKGDFTIYRLTQQNYYAVPLNESDYQAGLNDGDYVISLKDAVELIDQQGQSISPRERLTLPNVIHEQMGHTTAAAYRLNMPITITQSGRVLTHIARKQNGLAQPTLSGEAQLTDLSGSVSPVFLSRAIYLFIPAVPERLNHIVLTLTSAASIAPIVKRLDQLLYAGIAQIIDTGIRVQVGTLIREEPALYQINLRYDLTPLLVVPLDFSYLANIQITGLKPDVIYTPNHLPVAHLSNLTADQVQVSGEAHIVATEKGVEITWQDLRDQECRLYLLLNSQQIALAWQINRVFAWIEINGRPVSIVHDVNLEDVILRVRGTHSMQAHWYIGGQSRSFQLNARGQYDQHLRLDALADALQEQHDTIVDLEIDVNGDRWHVGRFVRQPQIKLVKVNYDEKNRRLMIEFEVGTIWQGEFTLNTYFTEGIIPDSNFLAQINDLRQPLQFDLSLPPGRYGLELTSNEFPVDLDSFNCTFVVGRPTELQPLVLVDDHTVFGTVLLPAKQFPDCTASEVADWMRAILAVHDDNRWSQLQSHLPAWAVFSGRLTMTTHPFWHKLSITPERAALRGQAGIGRALLELDGENLTTTYVKWYPFSDKSRSVRMYICVPPVEPDTAYYLLDEYDLWPVYICEKCGWFVGSRGGYARVSPRVWMKHRHGEHKPGFRDVAYDTRTSYKLMASIRPDTHTLSGDAQHMYNRLQIETVRNYFLELDDLLGTDLALATPDYFREAWHQASQANPVSPANWSLRERAIRHWLSENRSRNELPAAGALMRILEAFDSQYNLALAADTLTLAFLLRMRAVAEPQASLLYQSAGIQLNDLRIWTEAAVEQTPALLNWALVWAELLLVHAAS